MYSLRLLGGVLLRGPSGPLSGCAVQRRQLAFLACTRDKGLTRDKLLRSRARAGRGGAEGYCRSVMKPLSARLRSLPQRVDRVPGRTTL
jgi:hypothetical protein